MRESLLEIRRQFEREVGRIAERHMQGSVLSLGEFTREVERIYDYQVLDALPVGPGLGGAPIPDVPADDGTPAVSSQEVPPPPAPPAGPRPAAPATAPEIVADAVRRNMRQLSPEVRRAIHTYFGSSSGGDADAYQNLVNTLERTLSIRIRQELGRDAEILRPGNPQLHQMIEEQIREALREDRERRE